MKIKVFYDKDTGEIGRKVINPRLKDGLMNNERVIQVNAPLPSTAEGKMLKVDVTAKTLIVVDDPHYVPPIDVNTELKKLKERIKKLEEK